MMKVDDARNILAQKANELWNECLEADFFLNYDIIKNYLERTIEEFFFVSNMWDPTFLEELSKNAMLALINSVTPNELITETKVAKKMERADHGWN